MQTRFNIVLKEGVTAEQNQSKAGEFKKITLTLTAQKDVKLLEEDIRIGFFARGVKAEKGVILTHDIPVRRASLPFAFPALVNKFEFSTDKECAAIVCDYFKTSPNLRRVVREARDGEFKLALVNSECTLKKGDKLVAVVYAFSSQQDLMLCELIGKCASVVLKEMDYCRAEYGKPLSCNVSSFTEAAEGAINNLMDRRAVIQDGVGTFNPYGYHEIGAYTESFAAMDVAKGFYRFALSHGLNKPLEFIKNELYKLVNTEAEYPWIDDCHNTTGFFHLAWGAIPQDSGVNPDIKRSDLFSDYCGHEEGENLMSTFKYYDRVMLMGEMALLENDEKLKDGFKKLLPFVTNLKMQDFSQPVTYDLDSHLPATGFHNGGSGGGAALWALIQFDAYFIFGEKELLDNALKAVGALNKLDYDSMFSMRCAPKPIAVGAATRANILAYRITENKEYLHRALKFAEGIFAHYYLSPHPYTFFSAMGFGYACARERWEAFREMIETLWLALPVLEYAENDNLLRLYSLARQNTLWALPINGNPYGNMERDYESFGAEYIPFEFPTGHLGDNPGLEGGCQSSQRQIKEIYGSGELFLAQQMFEAYAFSHNPFVTVINFGCALEIPTKDYAFEVFNASAKPDKALISFPHLKAGMWETGGKIYSSSVLKAGYVLMLKAGERKRISLKSVDEGEAPIATVNNAFDVRAEQNFDCISLAFDFSADFYIVEIKNALNKRLYKTCEQSLKIEIDSELKNTLSITAVKNQSFYISQAVCLSAYKKRTIFKCDYVKCDEIKTENLSIVCDNHSYMLYGVNPDKGEAAVLLSLDGINTKDAVLCFDVSSLNNGVSYDARIINSKEKIFVSQNSTATGRQFVPLNGMDGDLKLEFAFKTSAALGAALRQICVFVPEETDISPVVEATASKNFTSFTASVCSGYEYAEVAIGEVMPDDKFKITVDGNELFNDMEKKFIYKVSRAAKGVYKVRLPDNAKEIKLSCGQSTPRLVHRLRFTNGGNYPIFTNYFNSREENI